MPLYSSIGLAANLRQNGKKWKMSWKRSEQLSKARKRSLKKGHRLIAVVQLEVVQGWLLSTTRLVNLGALHLLVRRSEYYLDTILLESRAPLVLQDQIKWAFFTNIPKRLDSLLSLG